MQLTPDDLTMVLGDLTMSLTTVFPLIKLFQKMGLFFFFFSNWTKALRELRGTEKKEKLRTGVRWSFSMKKRCPMIKKV